MKLMKKYLTIIGIFTVFLLLPLSVQIQTKTITNPINIGFTTKTKVNRNLIKINLSVANAELVDTSTGLLKCDVDLACYGINFLYLLFVNVGNILVGFSAKFMDFFLSHSLQSASYNGSDFIKQGWKILRDITNIIFIFALLFIAFQMVLGSGKGKAKAYLMKVILVTLTINFSMFFSYAIIDVSNIFAHVFYNKIDQENVSFQTKTNSGITGDISGKSTSLAIANKINPQKLFLNDGYTTKGKQMLMTVMAGVINGSLIYVFLSVAFLFLGRTLGLWIAVILSPLAFASLTLPALENIDYIGFKKWFPSLLKMAFMAPIFIFILYLAVQFMNVYTIGGSPSTLQNMLDIIMPMAMIIVLILLAKKVAEKMAGDFAGVISGMVGKIVGGTLAIGAMAVTGGIAAGGAISGGITQVAGSAAKKFGGEKAKAWGKKTIAKGKRMRSTKVMNVTKLPGFNKLASKSGIGGASQFFSKNLAGKSARSIEKDVAIGKRKLREKISGKDFAESEHKFEQEKARYDSEHEKSKNNAASWQEKIVDAKSSTDIKSEFIDILKQKDPSTGEINKKLLEDLNETFSKGLTVNKTKGVLEEIEYTDHHGYTTKEKMVDKTTGDAISRAEFERNSIKKYEKEVKEAERDLNNARATGNASAITSATDFLSEMEDQLTTFKKQTTTAIKEKAEKIEKTLIGQAREKVANGLTDKAAANRIRSGKVRVDFNEAKEK